MYRPTDLEMTGPLSDTEQLVFGQSSRDPVSGRVFEVGRGSLPKEIQQARFLQEQAAAKRFDDDQPKEGERCSQTNREFDASIGCLSKTRQTEQFLQEMPEEFTAQRRANFEALLAAEPAGKA
jgi:hypothetical protein